MSENTSIEWCDASINFWHGCTKVSAGCKNCYAESWDKRGLHVEDGSRHFGKGVERLDFREAARKQALKLDRKAAKLGKRLRVFTNSMGDWLDDEVPIEWLADLIHVITITPNLDWLLLTKRPGNFSRRLDEVIALGLSEFEDKTALNDDYWGYAEAHRWSIGDALENVWVGTSVENQAMAEDRIPELLEIPAKIRFLSCEPLLGPVDLIGKDEQGSALYEYMDRPKIDWVIAGGESGPKPRPMHPDWALSLRDQCLSADVPFFMKQMGGKRKPFPEIPPELMVREFPEVEGGSE